METKILLEILMLFKLSNITNNIYEKNFIIKNSIGLYFKLHFIDFYNDSGEKGYPKFALQQL